MFRRLLLTTALAVLGLPAMARDNYALLIGASDYQNLAPRWSLKGPKNDMALISTYLLEAAPVPFAPDHVTVLTDGTEGYDPATLDNIRGAFADLTAKAQPGDFIYIHMSGHGTRAPALHPEQEQDGLDELFLPVDIGLWDNSVGTVENALVDDEISTLLQGLRDKGADVWIVLDSCHSGTATRALATEDDVMMRQLEPEALGIPEAVLEEASAAAVSRGLGDTAAETTAAASISFLPDAPEKGAGQGSLVAFYAAQSTEMTPEMRLPRGKPDRKSQGVFTYTLFETLVEYPGATYGQIAQEVLRKYAVTGVAKTTPLFEGDLDQVIFGGEKAGRVSQWPATVTEAGFTLPAGSLHGLAEGTVLAVMPNAAGGESAALGYVTVTSVDTFTATAAAVATAGQSLPETLPAGLFLRQTEAEMDFSLTVALPPPGSAPADLLLAARADLQASAGPRLTFVASGAEADLALAVLPDSPSPAALWILPGTGLRDDLAMTPRVDTGSGNAAEVVDQLSEKLGAIAKSVNLMKLGAAMGSSTLDVDVQLQTKGPDQPTLRNLALTPVPTLETDDQVHVLARNNMDIPVDVNVLYLGADYAITHFYAGRLHPGEELKKGLFAIGGEVMGQERVLVVMTPAIAQSKIEDLSYLAQDAVRAVGEGSAGFSGALFEAGFGQDTRGAIPLVDASAAAGPGPAILQIPLNTRKAE